MLTAAAATARPPTREPMQVPVLALTLFAVGHVVLGWAMRTVPAIATVHALATVLVALVIAARRPVHQVGYAVAYIAGAEVLWRMNHAAVFWEYGKYAVTAVLAVAFLRMRLRRNVGLALGYIGLLLPSIALTIVTLTPDLARQLISFNMSGPVSLAMCVLFFSNVRLSPHQITLTFYALIGPVVGIAAVTYISTVSAEILEFNTQSNAITSGGFGPNQVSAMLGLALLLLLLMVFGRLQPRRMRWPLLVLAIVFATQCALTFSRGGLALTFASLLVAMVYFLRSGRTRITLLLFATLLTVVAKYVVIPRLDVFTEGKISERYTSAKTSNRDVIALADLQIFGDNIALGVGPGVAGTIRSANGDRVAAHTEFTRALAEHGILGAIAILLLFVLAFRTWRSARTLTARALVIGMLAWFNLFLLINAMRIVAPSVLFGLACAIAYASVRAAAPRIPSKLSSTADQSQLTASS